MSKWTPANALIGAIAVSVMCIQLLVGLPPHSACTVAQRFTSPRMLLTPVAGCMRPSGSLYASVPTRSKFDWR